MYLLTLPDGGEGADPRFRDEVRRRSGQAVELCFQCHQCTNGCPVAEFVKVGPNRVIRLVQLGMRRQALSADLIWLCPACDTCAVRCPNGISIRKVIDVLRGLSVAAGLVPLNHREVAFEHLFLSGVAHRGRVAELPLLLHYKVATREFFRDTRLGWQLLRRGKLPLKAPGVENRAQIRRLFATAGAGATGPGTGVKYQYLFRAGVPGRRGY